jgi:hypothetical protein
VSSSCGDAKGDQFFEDAYVEPWDSACEQRFRYGSSGIIEPTDETDIAAAKMIDILKLGDQSLELERKYIIEAFEDDIAHGRIMSWPPKTGQVAKRESCP